MKRIILITLTILTFQAKANINYIEVSKITNDRKLQEQFEIIKQNVKFYNHWTPEWNYEISKDELITQLEVSYKDFSGVKNQNAESSLLLGTISHYLYNLDKTDYHKKAIEHFSSVISNNPKEYRAFWFMGFHYSLSNNPNDAIKNLLMAKELLPKKEPVDFWENFAFSTAIANMPSYSIYAMDRIRTLTGDKGYFEEQLGDNIRQRIKNVDKNNNYKKEDIWTATEGNLMTFTCRPLGMKILVDTTWQLSIYDYNNGQSAFIITPQPIKNKKGREINYTIAILMKTANDNDGLDSYLNNFVSKYPNKTKIKLTDKYDNMIAYEIKDKNMYQDIGGGHLYMIGVERTKPKYPGLLLESPVNIPKGNTDELSFYTASDSQDRFDGKIFYAIMLDSCEDIHEKSFTIFKDFLDKLLIIE